MIYVYVDPVNINFPGFSLIVKNILRYIPNSKLVTCLDNLDIDSYILPIGVVAGLNLLNSKFKCQTIYYIDALTLGFSSVVKFSYRHRVVTKSCFLDALRLLKYIPIERKIVNSFNNVIVVSPHDQKYLEDKYGKKKFKTIMNGVSFPNINNLKRKQSDGFITIGWLYYWGCAAVDDVDWFVKRILPSIRLKYPNLKIIAAGRGGNNKVKEYMEHNNIVFLGDVENLYDFFNQIDVFVTTIRKECGILNKVLDAFAHKKIVLGVEHNMYPFSKIKDCFYTFKNCYEFNNAINEIINNPTIVEIKTEKAYRYLLEEHSWEKNMKKLNDIIKIDLRNE